MKKITWLVVAGLLLSLSPSYAALNPVAATRADDATDRTDGVEFDNNGAWVLTVADGNSLGTTAGVSAASLGNGGANAGTLTYAGNTTVSGDLGVAANKLLAINFNGSGKTATLASTADELGATTITVGSGATLRFGANTTVTGALVTTAAAGTTMDLQTFTVTETGAATVGAASTISSTVNSSSSFGNLVSSGNATIGNSTVNLTVAGSQTPGTALKILDGGAGGTNGATITVTDNSARYNFAGSNATGDILVTPTLVASNSVTESVNTQAAADAINGTVTGASGDLLTVQNALSLLSDNASLEGAYAQMDPAVDSGTTAASFDAASQAMGALSDHLAETRGTTGVSSGDSAKDRVFWAKGFGGFGDQSSRGGVDGYESWLMGTALGFEWPVSQEIRIGMGGGYAFSNVDSDGAGNADTDINNYQGTIYLEWTNDPWYVDTAFSFGWNTYDSTRDIVFGTINRQADSDYDGQQYTVYGEIGYQFKENGWEITPEASLQWTGLNVDGYTEDGAGALNLIVDDQGYDVLQSGLGLTIGYPVKQDYGTIIPSISGKWLYDFIGDEVETTSTFVGGGSSFVTRGFDPAQNSFDIGAELKIISNGDWTLSGNYDLILKEDYISNNGTITLRVNF